MKKDFDSWNKRKKEIDELKDNKYYVPVGIVDGKEASAIISQIRLIDTKHLYKQISTLDKDTFAKIQKAIKDLLF